VTARIVRPFRHNVSPHDDVAAKDLLNVEPRWSYTVCLSALARYLDLKAEGQEFDFMYSYARASLLRYAGWMVEQERPYFDQAEKLEYPTETWAAQELRKANVMRLAAAHADEPLRGKLLRQGHDFAQRAWSDLLRFESRTVTRALAIVMLEGGKDAYLRSNRPAVRHQPGPVDFGVPQQFTYQKDRVRTRLKSVRGLAYTLLRLLSPWRWGMLRYWPR